MWTVAYQLTGSPTVVRACIPADSDRTAYVTQLTRMGATILSFRRAA